MPIKNYTTEVSEEKTVSEIMSLLAVKGARSIHIDYDERNRPCAVGFVIFLKTASGDEFGVPVPFKLPCNFDGVFRAVESDCAALAQVFLPYATAQTTAGAEISMYDRFLQQVTQQKALPENVAP